MAEQNGQASASDSEDRNPFDIARDELGYDEYAGEADTEVTDELGATDDASQDASLEQQAGTEQESIPNPPELPADATPEERAWYERWRQHWHRAFTRARQADRASQGDIVTQHQELSEMFNKFYRNEEYAKHVIAQRFPHLAGQLNRTEQPASGSQSGSTTGITALLQQGLGEYGFLANAIGPVLEQVIDQQVNARVAERVTPLEQRTNQQFKQQRDREETELKSALDGKFPGWEEQFGAQMRELDDFILSDALHHPKFGSKYEIYHRLLNPGADRVKVAREMQEAGQRRSGLSQTTRTTRPNIMETVRKAPSNHDAFRAAVQGALEEIPDTRTG